VEVQDYPCPGWEHESTDLTLLTENGPEQVPAVAQTFTESCYVEAPLVAVGTREELEFAPALEGKVLVIHGRAVVRGSPER